MTIVIDLGPIAAGARRSRVAVAIVGHRHLTPQQHQLEVNRT